ncbi:hypothetical protein [Yeosuana aromativorans]|uniref:hypothetical protein n=1 Tax=Yeosuana aromativorans TaxID=288019 RepID=UPI0016634C48|nr:hypothetical protein [Yeosuana aromativorans]
MTNNFSKEQIKDLEKITDFFKSQICENQNSDFKTCFTNILPDLVEYGWQPILEKVDFEKQKELYSSISKSTFNEIWDFCKSRNLKTGEEFKSTCSKYDGKYQKFVTELGEKNPQIKEYAEKLIGAGDFSPAPWLQWNIVDNPKAFDLNDPNIQVLISIHYLSQNDGQKRDEKWETQ